jgi:hypothetical protein
LITTTSFKVPGRRIGVTTSSSFESTYVTDVAEAPPIVTEAPSSNPLPETDAETCCDAEPEPGWIAVTANGGVGVSVGTTGLAASAGSVASVCATTLRNGRRALLKSSEGRTVIVVV